jgi:hypothetical protein
MYETLGEMAEYGRYMADIWQRSKRNEKIESEMEKAGEEKETRGLGQ